MRELKNTKIIAVDHGYGNMKTANTVTPTGIKAYETEPLFCIIPTQFSLNVFFLQLSYAYLTAKQYHTGTAC